MYEPRHLPPISTGRFALRMALHLGAALTLVAISLLCGMFGYVRLEHMPWLDAFLNAAMLLGGMGPVKTEGLSDPGKLFAGIYALYSGVLFIAVMALMIAPVVHRVLHRFHWPEEPDRDGQA